MIKVLFFAQLREQLGCSELIVNEANLQTVAEVRDHLTVRYPQWEVFLKEATLLFAVNQTLVKISHGIKAGDEIAFFPPVTGG